MCIRDSAKIVLSIAYIVVLFMGSNALGLGLSVAFLLFLYGVARIPLKLVAKSLKPIIPIIIFTAILNVCFMPGVGPVSYTHLGAAQHAAVLCFYAVLYRHKRLGIFGGNAQHARQPAPQHGARPAQRHRCAHAHNIAGANGGGQRRGKRAKLADVAVRPFVFCNRKANAQKGFALYYPCLLYTSRCV